MEELEMMLQNGTIDAATYQKLKQRLLSSQLQEEQQKNESAIRDVGRYVSGERASGLGDVSVGGSTTGNIYMDQDELETYTSRGIAPTAGVDYQNIRAERQTWQDQLANGVTKAVGKTATGVAGGLAGLPTLAIVGLGQLTDALTPMDNYQWRDIYDNAFQRSLDAANESMDKALPNYVSNAQREASALGSMGTMNFWANDFLGGMSFVASALLTEYLTAGMATPLALSRASKLMKAASTAEDMAVVNRYANKFKNYVAADQVLKVGRQLVTGAGYEAGVEARHFIDQARDEFIQNYRTENNGEDPSDEELAAAMNDIHSVGNSVFLTNLALVSTGNMVALPKTFGPGLSKKLGINTGKAADAKWVAKPSELTNKQLARMAKNTGKSIDELKALDFVNKFDSLTKAEKLTRAAYGRGKGIVAEGFFEEGLQGVTNKAALDYVENLYNPDNIGETADVVDSVKRGFEQTYGLDQAEGWKEIIIGSLLGGMGGLNVGRAKGESIWQGGVFGYQSPSKSPQVNKLVEDAVKYGVATPETIKYAVRENGITRKQDDALQQGDMFEAKTQEYGSMLSYVSMMTKLGRFDEIDSEIGKMVQNMTAEEFSEQFGYTNLTQDELEKRKAATLKTFKDKSLEHRSALELAERVNVTGDPRLTDALAFTFGISKDIDKREMELSKTFQEKVGKIYSNDEVKTFAEYVTFQRTTDGKELKEYGNKRREKQSLFEEKMKLQTELEIETEKELIRNRNRTSTDIMSRGKKIDALQKEIDIIDEQINGLDKVTAGIEERLNKQYTEYLKVNGILEKKGEEFEYSRNRQEFKFAYEMFKRVQKDISDTVGEDFHTTPEAEAMLGDLNKLAAFRQQQITLANYYMTKEGQKKLGSQIDAIVKMHEDELVSAELDAAVEQAKAEKAYDTSMQDIAINAYINSAQKVHGRAYIAKKRAEVVSQLNQVTKDIKDPEVKALIEGFVSKLEGFILTFNVSEDDATKLETAKAALDYIKLIEGIVESSKEDASAEQIAEIDGVMNGDKFKSIVKQFQDFVKNYKKEDGAEQNLSIYPRVADPSKLTVMIQDYADGAALLADKSIEEILDNIVIKVNELPDNGQGLIYLQDPDRNKFDDKVMQQQGLVGEGMNKYGLGVYYDSVVIGHIMDPNRYRFKNEDGEYVDFDSSPEHLELLSPVYVKTDKDGNKTETKEGKRFIDTYRDSVESFEKLKDAIKSDPNKREFSNEEVKELFDVKAIFTGLSKHETASTEKFSEWSSLNDPKIQTDLSNYGSVGKGILIYYNLKNEINFYLYDPTTKTIKSLNDDTALMIKLNESFYSGSAQKEVNSTPGKLKVLYSYNNHIKSITLQQPEIDPTNNVAVNIVDKLLETSAKVKEEQLRRTKGEAREMVAGWDTSSEIFFTVEGTNKKFSLAITGVSDKSTSTKRNGSALELKIYTPGTKKDGGQEERITLTSTDDKFDEKTNKYSGFSLRRLSNGSTVLEYDNKAIKDNVQLLSALNKYIKNKTGYIEKLEEKGEEFKEGSINDRIARNLFSFEITDGKFSKKPIKILKMNKNFDKNDLESAINEFTPLRNPVVTYFFDGKPRSFKESSFQQILDSFNTDLKYAKQRGINALNTLKAIVNDAFDELNATDQNDNQTYYDRMIKRINDEIDAKKKNQEPDEENEPETTDTKKTTTTTETYGDILGSLGIDSGTGTSTGTEEGDFEPDAYFTSVNELSTEKIDIEEVKLRLKEILPEEVSIKSIDELVGALANNAFTYGLFRNSVIYLGKDVPKGTEYHEAFHAVFRLLLTPAQQAKVLSEAVTKYGKPTAEELNALKALSDQYKKLSLRELTNLWYEEKLADSFMDLMNGKTEAPKEKSFLQKILDILKSIVNFFKKGDPEKISEIDALFNSIKGGEFKTSKPINIIDSNLSLYSTLKYASNSETGSPIVKFQDKYTDKRITNKIFYKAYQKMKIQGYVTDSDIRDAVELVAKDYKDILIDAVVEDKFSRYDSGINNRTQDALKIQTVIKSISFVKEKTDALQKLSDETRESNIKDIIKTVRQSIDSIKFDDYDMESEETEDDVSTGLAQKPNQRVGGMSSVTKEFRKYLIFTEMPIDEFNFGIPQEILESDPKYKNYVNGIKLYNSLERMLINTERDGLLKKLYYIKEGQPQMEAFYSRLVRDIYRELDLPLAGNYEKDITEMSVNDLKISDKFCLFTACLTKHKIESVVNIVDPDTGKSRVFISNVNDARKEQRRLWFSNWKRLKLDNQKDFVISTLNKPLLLFKNTPENAAYLIDNFNDSVASVKADFNSVGIQLSDKFIQLSLFKIIADNTPELQIEDDSQFKTLDEIIKLYNDISYISEDNIRGILNSVDIDGDPYSNKKEIQKFVKNKITLTNEEEDALGAKGRINEIANGNALFDESVSPSTIRNVNNEMVYIHLYPNYISSLLLKIRNNYPALLTAIDADTYEQGLSDFRTFLNNNNLYIENIESSELIENFFRTLYNNPLLNDKHLNGELRAKYLQNLTAYLLDGLKQQSMDDEGNVISYKGSKASQYAALDKRGKFIMMMNLFGKSDRNSLSKKITIGTEVFETYSLIAFQNEGKNTQYAFNVFKREFISSNGDLSALGKEYLEGIFNTEANNIKTEYDRIMSGEGSLEGFNEITGLKIGDNNYSKQEVLDILKNTNHPDFSKAASKFRALTFVEFDLLKGYNPELYDSLIKSIVNNQKITDLPKIVETIAAAAFDNFINELSSLDTNIIQKTQDNTYKAVILPESFIDANGKVDMKELKQFFFNNWINASTINSLMFGNVNTGLKNSIDLSKRYAGGNAAGSSLGFGDLNFAIVQDELFNYVNPSNGNLEEDIERTNGQSYGTLDWYYNNYLKTFSKLNPEVERIYRKIRMMYEITGKEKEVLEKYGALINPRKTSMFNAFIYGKTSTDVIDRNEVSYVEPEKLEAFRKAMDDLLKTKDSNEYQKKLIAIQDYYKPYPKSVKLHQMLNKMERQQVDVVFFRSAIKTNKQNITNWDDDLKPMKISNDFFREQVVTDNMKSEIIHGTQMMQLIYSEHDDKTIVKLNGSDYSIGTLRKLYRRLLGDRLFRTYGELRKAVLNPDGSTNFKSLLSSFKQSLIEQGGDPTLLELFDGVGEKSNYNLNLPRILSLYETMFLSFMGKGTFSQKVPGHKFTLSSDFSNGVMEQNGKIVTDKEYRTNPSKYADVSTRDLEFKYDEKKNAWYGECKIPMQIAEAMGLKVGDELPQEFLEMVGVRIPTQDKHSMIYLKVVDILPAQKGNKIIMPKEVLILSGADFDIDSEFARTVAYYVNKDAQGKSHFNIYGSYLQKDTADRRIKYAFFDFKEEMLNSKAVKILLKDAKENSEELTVVKKLIENTSYNIKELKKQLKENNSLSYKIDNDISDAVNADELTFATIMDSIKSYLDDSVSNSDLRKDIAAFLNEKKELLEQKKKVVKAIENKILKDKGYPTDVESFKSYRIDGKSTAEAIVEANYKNYNKIDGGSIDRIQPITINELNNILFDIEKLLINNGKDLKSGNHKIAQTPASRDIAAEFVKKYYTTGKFKDPVNIVEYSTPTAIVKISDANTIGGENIGIAAVGNIVFQYLKNANILVEGGVNVNIDSFTNEEEQRINDIISTIISMAVDNAKEQDAVRFNITPATQGAFMFMIMTKKGFEYTSLVHLQESVLRFSQQSASNNSPIKPKKEKDDSDLDDISTLLAQYLVASDGSNYNLEYLYSKYGDLTEDMLIRAKIHSENKEISTLSEEEFSYINYRALEEFEKYRNISQKSTGFSQFISLVKGLKTGLAETENISAKLKAVGLEIIKKEGSDGNNFEDYDIRHTNEYIYYVEMIKAIDGVNEKYPIDYLQVIKSDPFLNNQIKAYALFLNDSSKFFITQTPKAKKLVNKLSDSLKETFFNKADNYNKILKLLTAYYGNHAFLHDLSKRNVRPLVKEFDIEEMVTLSDSETMPTIINLYIELMQSPELATNRFLGMLDFEKIMYDDDSKGGFKNRNVYNIISNSFIRLSPEEQKDVTSDFEMFKNPEILTQDKVLQQKIADFRVLMTKHLLMKDLSMYRNKSFVGFLPPSFFDGISKGLDSAQKALEGKAKFEDVFGMSEEAFNQSFIERFCRDINNTFDLRSQRSDIVFRQIKNSYIKFLKNLSDKDRSKLGTTELGKKIISISNAVKAGASNDEIAELMQELRESNILPLNYTAADKDDPESKITLEVSIFSNIGVKEDYDPASYNPVMIEANKEALEATGLFSSVVTKTAKGKFVKDIVFPEFIVFNFKDNKGGSHYKLLKRTDLKNKGTLSKNPNAGFKAKYTEIARLGSKQLLPYLLKIEQLEAAAEGLLPEEIDMEDFDMSFGLTAEDFEGRFGTPEKEVKKEVKKETKKAATKLPTSQLSIKDGVIVTYKGNQYKVSKQAYDAGIRSLQLSDVFKSLFKDEDGPGKKSREFANYFTKNNKLPDELLKIIAGSSGKKILEKLNLNSYFVELDLQNVKSLDPYKGESTSAKDYKNMSIAEVSSVFEKYKNKLIENKIGNPLDLLSHFRNSAFTNKDIEEFLELCK
jgi:hypothetical protein